MTAAPSRFVPPDLLRARFAAAMSDMYRAEVPLYSELLDLVGTVNAATDTGSADRSRIDRERHGAIRLGTAAELRIVARAFAVLGMVPVGYYDLSAAGLPVHSTAFRPIGAAALAASPFRMFTSLLRIEDVAPAALRDAAAALLAARRIVVPEAERLIDQAECDGGLDDRDGAHFVEALIETFRWHSEARVSAEVYAELAGSHRLLADIVSFRGPHINHLTPRVIDIDAAWARMKAQGFDAKETIEGPPRRDCPVLLRQTSFKALDETILFPASDGALERGVHSARFGEIEQRGVALTHAGRARYDRWLGDGGDLDLPDDWAALHDEGLAFFRYLAGDRPPTAGTASIRAAIEAGWIRPEPITYEDFLPVSAAGIFRSNLGEATPDTDRGTQAAGGRSAFEEAMGRSVLDEMALYESEVRISLKEVEAALGITLR